MSWNRSIKMFVALFSLAAVLTACGGGAKEAKTAEPTQDSTPVTAATETPADQTTASSDADTSSDSNTSETDSSVKEGQIGLDSTMDELVEKYADNVGYIRIPLDDHPVRRVSEKDSKNVNIANYSDAVVDVNTGRPIHTDSQQLIDDAFPFFTTIQAPNESYITWEEATNLERAMVKTLFIAREGLLITEEAMNNKDYSAPSFVNTLRFFQQSSEFESMAPVAQTTDDITLTTLYDKARTSWAKLAEIDPAQDETAFAEAYKTARTDANNAMGFLNVLLSTNKEERIKEIYGE
ncbi:hypothetical protein [Paenibacillus xylanexedens]|uniref:hypothetical protein n=1 Tax=Paenibacillus xylanexedens TaxID=528191 RepID=UPI00119D206C|nr:hypothetical protein [Paenibacillus xylanexedens]